MMMMMMMIIIIIIINLRIINVFKQRERVAFCWELLVHYETALVCGSVSIPVSNLNKLCICATRALCVFIPNRTAVEQYNNKGTKLSLLCKERSPEASRTLIVVFILLLICLNGVAVTMFGGLTALQARCSVRWVTKCSFS